MPIKRSRKDEENQITPEGMVDDLVCHIQSMIQSSSKRLQYFIAEYRNQFMKGPDWTFTPEGLSERDILNLLKAPLIMYAMKLNGQVIIEIHGILERYAILAIVNLSNSFPSKFSIDEITERCVLPELAKILVALNVWDKEDIEFAENLDSIRNGTVHKNPKKVSYKVYSGKNMSFMDIDKVLSNYDVLPYMITAIRLLFKLYNRQFFVTVTGKE
jgi:hypothetical protein